MANTLKVTLVKSPIGAVPKHKKTVAGLTALKTPEEFARLRGKSVEEIVG